MIFESGDCIVFAGDSVTDMGSAQPVGDSTGNGDPLGIGYVRIFDSLMSCSYPDVELKIYNAGISGNTSRDLRLRFERDIVPFCPDWLFICIGINDVWRQFDSSPYTDAAVLPEKYEENLDCMINAAKEIVKGIFILTPYYMEPLLADKMRARMEEYCDICRRLAEKHGCRLVDFQKMYDSYFSIKHSSSVAWDRVHPNQRGAMLMAREILRQCDFDFDREPYEA